MTFISKQDLYTHIYEEAITTISRGDDNNLQAAIDAATAIVSRYLVRYDTTTIFAAADTKPYAELIGYMKDIIKWKFIGVCNVQVDYEDAKKRYDDAMKQLDVIKRSADIPGWPLADNSTENIFRSGSNTKFNSYF